MSELPYPLQQFQTADGRDIYKFTVQAFPPLATNIYVIDDGDQLVMVDTGSSMPESNQHLMLGFEAISEARGRKMSLADVDLILLTHAHIDHFGGLKFVREHTQAPVGIHQLDVRVISNFEERRVVAARKLDAFAEEAGVSPTHRENMMAMYLYDKRIFESQPVDFVLSEAESIAGIQFHHVPGHCPGQVCMQIDDILLTGDHILARTTPNLAPESITLNTGLGHFYDSLDKIADLGGISLALGGHEAPMEDVYGRIQDMKAFHERRLDKVREACRTPKNIVEVSKALFGQQRGYHVLLALSEAGAHVEYLYLRGELAAANVEEIEYTPHPVIQYQTI